MTSPTIVPVAYTGTNADYFNCKINRNGPLLAEENIVNVPTGATTASIIGLLPFRKGCRFSFNSIIMTNTLTGGGTVNIGYIYRDSGTLAFDGSTLADNLTAYATGASINGAVVLTASPGADVLLKADGWIVATLASTTTAAGTISAEMNFKYDQI